MTTVSPISLGVEANPFATPLEILPEWYFFPTFNLLRILSSKFIGVLSQLYLPGFLLIVPFNENISIYQNPFRRPVMTQAFLLFIGYSLWLGTGSLASITMALPFI